MASKSDNWSPSSLVSQALKSDLDPGVFSVIDESDIRRAPNFVDFCLNKHFLNVVPYPRQIEIGLGLFEDYCPSCTKPEWLYGERKELDLFDQPIAEILDNVQLLEFGKCPKCEQNRNDFVQQGIFSNPYELAACEGQRCLVSSTLVLTEDGLVEIGDYAKGKPKGFSAFSKKLHTGQAYGEATAFFVSAPETTYTVDLSNGLSVTGTADHPLLTSSGFTNISDLRVGDTLPISYGQDLFGTTIVNYSSFHEAIEEDFSSWLSDLQRPGESAVKKHKLPSGQLTLDDARFIGYLIAEGNTCNGLRISNTDGEILDFCEKILVKWFGQCGRSKRDVSIRTKRASLFAGRLLGPSLSAAKSGQKSVPSCIRKAPREHVCAFLSGLYEGAGYVSRRAVEYSTLSKELATHVNLLLQNLGVPSKICSKRAHSYTVIVEGAALGVFRENISCGLDVRDMEASATSSAFVSVVAVTEAAVEPTFDFTVADCHSFWANGITSSNSGKSALTAMIAAYVLHRYLVIPDPIRFFGLLPSSQLYMTMTAVSAGQAEALLWTPFKEYVDEAPWFKEYHQLLSDTGERLGTELLHRPRTFLVYKHKRIAAMYEAPNKRRLRGKTRIFSAIDELGWMEADATKQSVTLSADEISAALDNSLRTIRGKSDIKRLKQGLYNTPDAYACNVSSPSSKDDKIMRNIRAARDNRKIYAVHLPTWEANPEITRESLESEFQKSRMVAERDFGAVPPLANDPFLDNPKCVDLMICEDFKHDLLQVKIDYNTDDFGNVTKFARVHVPHVDKRKPRMLLCDAGEKRNHFAVMLMTWDAKMNRPRVDFTFDVAPEEGIPINFVMMWEHCFKPMCDGLLLKHMFSDTWNSTELAQKLRQHKVMSEQYTLKFQDFMEIGARLNAGELMLPKPELPVSDLRLTYENPVEFVAGKPVLTLILQMLTVRQVGKRVTKPINGDDDVFRALAMGMHHIMRPEMKKLYAIEAAGGAGGNIGVIFPRSAGVRHIDPQKQVSGAIVRTKSGARGR